MKFQNLKMPKSITDKFTSPIPPSLIKERQGGGKMMLSYISGSTVTDLLNSAFGYMWNWTVKKEWIQISEPYFNQYSKSPDKVVNPINGKTGAWEEQGPVAHVLGTLEVFISTEDGQIISIKKDGYGSKSILGKQNDQESIFKAAGTDALKKAASLLGVGLELYRDEEEQIFFDEISYEDPWTTEVITEHENSLAIYNEYIDKYQLLEDDIASLVYEATGCDYNVFPENIDKIAEYINAIINNSGEE